MKFSRILLVLGLLTTLSALRADDTSTTAPAPSVPPAAAPDHPRGHRRIDPDRMVARLDHAVGPLTDDQKAKIKDLVTANLQKARDAVAADRRSIMQNQRQQIRALLTPDQQQKFDQLPQHRRGAPQQ